MVDVGWRPLASTPSLNPLDVILLSFLFFFLTPLTYGLQLVVPVLSPFLNEPHLVMLSALFWYVRGSSTGVFKICSLVSSSWKLFGSNRMLIMPIEARNMLCILFLWFYITIIPSRKILGLILFKAYTNDVTQ